MLHKYIYAVLCVIQIIGHNDHASTFCNSFFTFSLDPSMYSEQCSLPMIPMSGLNFPLANYGSIFREINLQNHTQSSTNDFKEAACFNSFSCTCKYAAKRAQLVSWASQSNPQPFPLILCLLSRLYCRRSATADSELGWNCWLEHTCRWHLHTWSTCHSCIPLHSDHIWPAQWMLQNRYSRWYAPWVLQAEASHIFVVATHAYLRRDLFKQFHMSRTPLTEFSQSNLEGWIFLLQLGCTPLSVAWAYMYIGLAPLSSISLPLLSP